jgi:CRP/FNR family transcriptional regulator, cyclic AMP receptor protein
LSKQTQPVSSNFLHQLRQIPFFTRICNEEIIQLCNGATFVRLSTGRSINFGKNIKSALVVVLEGQLQIIETSPDGRPTGLSLANAGTMIGWLSVIDNLPLQDVYRATSPTELLLLTPQACKSVLLSKPDLNQTVMQMLARTIRDLQENRNHLTMPNAFQRVFFQILHSSKASTHTQATPLAKQHEIASIANTSRETVSRALHFLIRRDVLVKEGRSVIIKNPELLKRLAYEGIEE